MTFTKALEDLGLSFAQIELICQNIEEFIIDIRPSLKEILPTEMSSFTNGVNALKHVQRLSLREDIQ